MNNQQQHWVCCVTYYGEYLPFVEPHVFADSDQEAIKKAFEFCSGMNQKELEIKVYPYINGYK